MPSRSVPAWAPEPGAVRAPAGSQGRRRPGHPAYAALARTPLVSREGGSGTRDTLAAALGPDTTLEPPALSLSTTAAVRALTGAAPAVISELAVTSDLSSGQLIQVPTPDLDLRRILRAIWDGTGSPPVGAARDLIIHILSPRRREPASPLSAGDN